MTVETGLIRATGFEANGAKVTFGILWDVNANAMTDWTRESRFVDLPIPGGGTVTQLLGMGPRRATYRLLFETVAEFQALDALVQRTGTLTIQDAAHTVPVSRAEQEWIFDGVYDQMAGVTLLSLVNGEVWPDGEVEADATFMRTES